VTEPDRLKATPEPLPEASEADLADQMQTAISDPDDEPAEPSPQVPLEADPADALEQQQPLPDAGPDEYP
jgi:hypothetical protein